MCTRFECYSLQKQVGTLLKCGMACPWLIQALNISKMLEIHIRDKINLILVDSNLVKNCLIKHQNHPQVATKHRFQQNFRFSNIMSNYNWNEFQNPRVQQAKFQLTSLQVHGINTLKTMVMVMAGWGLLGQNSPNQALERILERTKRKYGVPNIAAVIIKTAILLCCTARTECDAAFAIWASFQKLT